jgi:2-C-methyl-D-erythritol 4-phosphate cytidylyltransferase
VKGGVGVVLPAAGTGRRMGGRRKAWMELLGEPILLHALRPFLRHPEVEGIVVVVPSEDLEAPPPWLDGLDPRLRLARGGSTRFASVRAGLEELPEGTEVVLVHDAARPLVTREMIDRCIAGARRREGAVAGWPSTDTLKEVDGDGRVLSTPDRARYWRAHTPQAFPFRALREAYAAAEKEGATGTDDAVIFERAGGRVRMVEGSAWNLKVTYPEDAAVAELLLAKRASGSGAEGGP